LNGFFIIPPETNKVVDQRVVTQQASHMKIFHFPHDAGAAREYVGVSPQHSVNNLNRASVEDGIHCLFFGEVMRQVL